MTPPSCDHRENRCAAVETLNGTFAAHERLSETAGPGGEAGDVAGSVTATARKPNGGYWEEKQSDGSRPTADIQLVLAAKFLLTNPCRRSVTRSFLTACKQPNFAIRPFTFQRCRVVGSS
jgi:hypothetical protein